MILILVLGAEGGGALLEAGLLYIVSPRAASETLSEKRPQTFI